MERPQFSFFFKKKEVNVDCFTSMAGIAEVYPATKSFEYIPDWWKSLKPSNSVIHEGINRSYDAATMKGCSGITDLYKKGFVIPLWADFNMYIEEDCYQYLSPFKNFEIRSHSEEQHNYALSKYHHAKITSPWLFQESKGINFLFLPCTWSHITTLPGVTVLPGVVNFKHIPESNVNFLVPKVKNVLKALAGTPLVQVIPITEHNLKLNIQIVTEQEWAKISNKHYGSKFLFNSMSMTKRRDKNHG